MDLIARLKTSPIAINTTDANSQHYEVPTEFYLNVLGPEPQVLLAATTSRRRTRSARPRSACSPSPASARGWRTATRILELGCGWGSLSLWMAEHYPNARIIAVSNSRTQKAVHRRARRASGA